MPNWLSYSGEGCSLSFHIPSVFLGLVLWAVHPLEKDARDYYSTDIIIIIRNKSNGIQLFKGNGSPGTEGWIRYISRSEMAMEDYCGDDEFELCISSEPTKNYGGDDELHIIKECRVHVIAGKVDSFEESEVGRDTVMPSPPPYHLLPHSHCGSITASTPNQWSDFLFAKLQGHSLDLVLDGENKYFI
jgi:leucine-rich repeat protein SHOC2